MKCRVKGEGVFGNNIWWYVKNVNSSKNVCGHTSDHYFAVAGGNPPVRGFRNPSLLRCVSPPVVIHSPARGTQPLPLECGRPG